MEVVDDAVRPPPADRDGVCIDETGSGNDRRDSEERPAQPLEVLAAQVQRSAEEEGADRHEVVPEGEADRLVTCLAIEHGLRDQRVDDDERCKGDGEPVHDARSKRQLPHAPRLVSDARERDGEQDLLPGGDRGERRAAHAGGV